MNIRGVRAVRFVDDNSSTPLSRCTKSMAYLLVIAITCFSPSHAFGESSQTTDPQHPAVTGQVQEKTIRVGNRERSYVTYVPANLQQGAALVIALHGYRATGLKMRRHTGWIFETLADRNGFVLVYPDGYQQGWNDCLKNTWNTAKVLDIDDVGFMRALIQSIASEAKIDLKKVYIFGFSNGGNMALRLASEAPNEIAAVVAVGANWPTQESSLCASEGMTSRVMLVNGDSDSSSPYEGGKWPVPYIGSVMSKLASATALAKRNGILEPPSETIVAMPSKDDSTSVHRLAWSRGGQLVVALYTVRGGGHTIPQPVFRYPEDMGVTSEFDAPSASWTFFSSP